MWIRYKKSILNCCVRKDPTLSSIIFIGVKNLKKYLKNSYDILFLFVIVAVCLLVLSVLRFFSFLARKCLVNNGLRIEYFYLKNINVKLMWKYILYTSEKKRMGIAKMHIQWHWNHSENDFCCGTFVLNSKIMMHAKCYFYVGENKFHEITAKNPLVNNAKHYAAKL